MLEFLYYDPYDPFLFGMESMILGMVLVMLIPLAIGIIIIVLIVRSIMGMGKDDKTIVRSPGYNRDRRTPRESRYARQTPRDMGYERPAPEQFREERTTPPPQPETPSGFCPNCGAGISKDDAFCISCGRYLSG